MSRTNAVLGPVDLGLGPNVENGMSDVMLLGMLRMPMPDNPDPLTLRQFVERARQAADRIEADEAEIERLRLALVALMRHFPTDSDMVELGWESDFIEAACQAHDKARATVGAA